MQIDINKINADIVDRNDLFYWQADRKVSPEVAGTIWADRFANIDFNELKTIANKYLTDKIVEINPASLNGTKNGINIVRAATTESGREVIIRAHPRGIRNGYFFAESAAANAAIAAGLPTYHTYATHELTGPDDNAMQVIEKMPGTPLNEWLAANPSDEKKIAINAGKMMARLHKIQVSGYGPFDNDIAKSGQLKGLHKTFESAVNAALSSNLNFLSECGLLSEKQISAILELYTNNPLLISDRPILVHNDFADWNLLTMDGEISAIIDWDECIGGTPASDIASYSSFFEATRMESFLSGYFSVSDPIPDFDEKFQLLRLRYIIMKMTLRLRRYTFMQNEYFKYKIELGKKDLAVSLKYFGII